MKVIIKKLYVFTENDSKLIDSFLEVNKISINKFSSLIGYPEAFTKSVIYKKERCDQNFVDAVRGVIYECRKSKFN